MKVYLTQIYIEQGASFPFTHEFQILISELFSSLVLPSNRFSQTYGPDWDVILRISAKKGLNSRELRGPTAFRRDRDVEYTIFLPYDLISASGNPHRNAIREIIGGACDALNRLHLNVEPLIQNSDGILEKCLNDQRTVRSSKGNEDEPTGFVDSEDSQVASHEPE